MRRSLILLFLVCITCIGCGVYTGTGTCVAKLCDVYHEGLIWKTWEGHIIADEGSSMIWPVTFENQKIAQEASELLGKMVIVEYIARTSPVPWQGSTKNLITKISLAP